MECLSSLVGTWAAESVHEGNVTDSTTFVPEVQRLREQFGIEQLVIAGDASELPASS